MAEIRVTFNELRNKASELRQLNNQFRKAVEDLAGNEQQLMGMWDGEAKNAFHNAFEKDKGQMGVFYDTIEKYCQTLEADADKYMQEEQKNVQTATTRSY